MKTISGTTCNSAPDSFHNSSTLSVPVLTGCDTCADDEYQNEESPKFQHDALHTGANAGSTLLVRAGGCVL
jgi:hypothetical protein